ncbi:phage late control D family protein [Sorangium sp. So ce542]|uniref:phage late control D family protein n=1 Tax=Sorangium sp. So ce542 TaxID=3133316 RepID=UPI003F5F63F1
MPRYARYAPEFSIRLDGENLPIPIRSAISSLSYTDGIEGADRVELALANPSLRLLDHPLLSVDREFRLSIGYAPDPLEEVFVGEITGVEPSFPSSGMPTLRIVAQDFLHRLGTGTKDRAFRISIPSIGNFPLPDTAVAAIVSGLNLLVPLPDPINVIEALVSLATYTSISQQAQQGVRRQTGQSDFDFLRTLARENGWQMYIDHTLEPKGRVLRFQFLIQDYAPSLSLTWGKDLIEFTPRLTTVGDVFGVSARVWVDSVKMEFVIVVSWDYDRAALNAVVYPSLVGDIADVLGSEQARRTISITPTGLAAASRGILTELLPRLNNRLTGSGSTIGDPRIKGGRVIDLNGLGGQFSGLYRITQATHTIDASGYRTGFQARKEVWFSGPPLPTPGKVLRLQGQFSV